MSSSSKRTILITGSDTVTLLLMDDGQFYSQYYSSCSTGGAGHTLALEFAAKSLRVFATARSIKSLANLEDKGIEVFPLEVTSAESIQALKEEILRRTGGKLDMLFNNAGFSEYLPLVTKCVTLAENDVNTKVSV